MSASMWAPVGTRRLYFIRANRAQWVRKDRISALQQQPHGSIYTLLFCGSYTRSPPRSEAGIQPSVAFAPIMPFSRPNGFDFSMWAAAVYRRGWGEEEEKHRASDTTDLWACDDLLTQAGEGNNFSESWLWLARDRPIWYINCVGEVIWVFYFFSSDVYFCRHRGQRTSILAAKYKLQRLKFNDISFESCRSINLNKLAMSFIIRCNGYFRAIQSSATYPRVKICSVRAVIKVPISRSLYNSWKKLGLLTLKEYKAK